MDIFIGSRNYDPIMASMAFPYKWVWLFDLKKLLKVQNAIAICGYFFEFKRKIAKYLTRHDIKKNGVLPDATFFEASIYVFAIHGVIYPPATPLVSG
jgi:hypothetical protein